MEIILYFTAMFFYIKLIIRSDNELFVVLIFVWKEINNIRTMLYL